ncbi:exonuclease domain-containing protein [Aliikangiella sp. IMCC44632]
MNINRLICFDLEMCCWDDGRDPGEIIEIGVVEVNMKAMQIEKELQLYVKPESDDVSSFCEALTGISATMLDTKGVSLKSAVARLESEFCESNRLFGSWGRDDEWLATRCNAIGIKSPIRSSLNLKLIFQLQHRLKNCSQSRALQIANIERTGREHSGLDDARNLARLAMVMFPFPFESAA